MLGLTILHCNMLMLDLSKYKCYRMKYRLHMGTAHMACDPEGGAIMAQKIKVILKGDALEDARRALKANRKICLEGNQNLRIEQEGVSQSTILWGNIALPQRGRYFISASNPCRKPPTP